MTLRENQKIEKKLRELLKMFEEDFGFLEEYNHQAPYQ